jgi:hypothetical protein
MMANDQYANAIFHYAKEEVIGESVEIHTSNIPLMSVIGFRRVRSFEKIRLEFSIELFRELRTCDILVVIHNPRDVGMNFLVKLQPH